MERVLCAPVLTVREAVVHPHLRQRGTVRRVRTRRSALSTSPGCQLNFPAGRSGAKSLPTVSASITKRCCASCCA
jgi:crotonobetainyl-CoA:carnitine CoA-transferase CaiB-like acyl-CoA transferase